MSVRVKKLPNSPRQSVQIVQSVRKGSTVSQKIVRHIGIAYDNDELEKLKWLVPLWHKKNTEFGSLRMHTT